VGITVEMTCASLSDLLDALDGGEQLLLPNARAARELRWGFDARQRARGLVAWEPPRVQSWSQWTNSQWSELVVEGAEDRLLLNAAQEQSVWREIIAADPDSGLSGSVDALAKLAGSAWKLAASYSATQQLQQFAMTHDSRTFAQWADAFLKSCKAQGYVSAALLDAGLLQHAKAGTVVASASITLVGFEELLPSQKALVDAFRERGTEVVERGA
jgi:ATP-dependent helicase/nuclease subunit B